MGRATQALATGADLVLRALTVQGIWALGTLAGGIVLGWAPATMAALGEAAAAERGERLSLRRAARSWRESFWRSQVTLGLPGIFLLLATICLLSGVLPLAAQIALGLVTGLLLIAVAHVPELEVRYDLPATRAFGAALTLGLAQAPTSLVLLAVLALWTAVLSLVPGLLPFLGIGVPLLLIHHLVSRTVDRNEDLLGRDRAALPAARADPAPVPRP